MVMKGYTDVVQTLVQQIAQFLPAILAISTQIDSMQKNINDIPLLIKDSIDNVLKESQTTTATNPNIFPLNKNARNPKITTNDNMKLAEILSKSSTDATTIRNINLIGNPETCKKTVLMILMKFIFIVTTFRLPKLNPKTKNSIVITSHIKKHKIIDG